MSASSTILSRLKSHRRLAGGDLRLAAVLGALGGLLVVAQAWLVAHVIDAAVMGAAGLDRVMPWLWGLPPVFALRFAAGWSAEQLAFRGAGRIKAWLRAELFAKLQRLGPVRLSRERTGELSNSLLEGVDGLESYYARYVPATALVAMVPPIILAVVLPADWVSALIMLVSAPLIPLFMILIGRGAERLNQRQWRRLARMGAHFLDTIQGLTTLKLFNASRREAEVIARVADDYRRSTMAVLRIAFLSSAALEFFATVSIALIAVLIGFRLLDGEMTFFHGLFVLLLAPEFYLPLRNLAAQYHARMEAIGAAEMLVELLDRPEPAEPDRPYRTEGPDPRVPPGIRFENVSFRYPGERAALCGLNLEIAAGETVALVGPSGAGKSTVASLLLRFIEPDAGTIHVDGLPLSAIERQCWLQRVAWIPQRPRLFSGSLADNLRLAAPAADRDDLIAAARAARAHEFIEELPQGYDTAVGEGGEPLSGGQIQRLAIARAILKDAPLVILDEPTAHLDRVSEQAVHQALRTLARGRTLLIIAHRLQTTRTADRILVLDRGRLVEQGGFEELHAAAGLFRRMLAAGEGPGR